MKIATKYVIIFLRFRQGGVNARHCFGRPQATFDTGIKRESETTMKIQYGVIYSAVSPSGKEYIGCTENLARRKYVHKYLAHKGINTGLYRAIRKYGWKNIAWRVIEYCPLAELSAREIFWVADHNTFNNGYNMTPGGETPPTKVQNEI